MTNQVDDTPPASKPDRSKNAPEESRQVKELRKRLEALEEKAAAPSRLSERILSSNRSLFFTAIIAALILSLLAFFLIRGFQWRGAMADFRAEPGIQIFSVRPVGILKRRVTGLRDPLSPNPRDILRNHNIDPALIDFQLAEYHSLNTPYGQQRTVEEEKELEQFRNMLVEVVGTLSEENRRLRENELGRISQILLEMRFPEEMKKLDLRYEDGVWFANGELLSNESEEFKALAPKYILNGVVDFENIGDFTQAKTAALKIGIESYNLLDKTLDGEWAHLSRIARLVRDYDALCLKSGISSGNIEMILRANDPISLKSDVEEILEQLIEEAQLIDSRIELKQESDTGQTAGTRDRLFLRIAPDPN